MTSVRRAALLVLAAIVLAAGQGEIKFDFQGRYDTALTQADTLLLEFSIVELHRKIARAAYASYYRRDPSYLAAYTDVQADSIRQIADVPREQTLVEITVEIGQASDSAVLDRVILNRVLFHCDTIVQVWARTPFDDSDPAESDAGAPAEAIYLLHLDRDLNQWWVRSIGPSSAETVFHNYLRLPDQDLRGILR